MDISFSLVKELGYKKINKYFEKRGTLSRAKCSLSFLMRGKMSAYTIANDWSAIFGELEPKYTGKFIEWYKLYYPTVGVEKNQPCQNKVFKAYMSLKTDYYSTSGCDICDLGIYVPVLDVAKQASHTEPSDDERELMRMINCIYAWGIECHSLIQEKDKESFRHCIEVLTYDTESFLEYLER